jgi:hypothetical protein
MNRKTVSLKILSFRPEKSRQCVENEILIAPPFALSEQAKTARAAVFLG